MAQIDLYQLGYDTGQADAGRENADLRLQLDAANDLVEDLRTEVEATLNAALVEQTYLRQEVYKLTEGQQYWVNEATTWARWYVEYVQKVDDYNRRLDVWIKGLKANSLTMMLFDVMIMGMAMLFWFGVVKPLWP